MVTDDAAYHTILGKDVEQKVTDCLQKWQAACSNAVKEMMEQQKQDDDPSRAQFVISLIGNLAWASTVFFPRPQRRREVLLRLPRLFQW
jgi:hypothetical protein